MTATPKERELCLEPLTVLDCPAEETAVIAAEAGFPHLSLWVESPGPELQARCIIEGAAMADRVKRTMSAGGVRARNLEVYVLAPDTDVAGFRPSLDLGASLGAVGATAIFRNNPDPGRRLEQFVQLCQLAQEFGLRVNAEFISHNDLGSLGQAIDLVEKSGQLNAGVVVDLLHLTRSGGTPDEVRHTAPRLIGHAQLCDGPATASPERRPIESARDRMIPGEGAFPVRAFVEALPDGPLGLEVPATSVAFQGLTPIDRVKRLVEVTRRTLAG